MLLGLVLSLVLHWAALAWIDERFGGGEPADPRPTAPVVVALLPPPAVAAVAGEARPSVRPSPPPRAQRATPRPGAIDPRAVSGARHTTTGEPSTQSASPEAFDPLASAGEGVAEAQVGEPVREAATDREPGIDETRELAARKELPRDAGAESLDPLARAQTRGASDPGAEHAGPLPQPPVGHWRFEVHYGDYADGHQVASLDYSITHDGRRYRLRSEGRAEGLTALLYSGVLTQSSEGRLSAAGLEPERYAEQRGRRPERWASVDRAAGRVSFSGGESLPMVAGVQDRLSVLVQIGLIARASPARVEAGSALELPELGSRSIERARYESRGEVTLTTARGPIRALHLERVAPRRAEDPRVEVWLGYDRGMLPVRIRLTDVGGRVLDQISPP